MIFIYLVHVFQNFIDNYANLDGGFNDLSPREKRDTPKFNFQTPAPIPLPQLQGGGGGSRSHGFDVGLQATEQVWKSDNGRHSVDVTGQYGQHLGGPYGSSRPQGGGGARYTFRF